MKLDGYDVDPGDLVYDLFFGDGIVRNLTADGRAVVAFGPRAFTYNESGVGQHGKRSLYWHNPILLVPMKSETQWGLQRALNQAIAQTLRPGAN
ncbi:hypothetical protein [Paraburkholderia antibiotica]|jgi:hypothetical protein|uniref:Uncharacterized protein n=1 Tax=Paraburkholderia antibiotica TaxID=2728839 RepID=A0A7Y0A122_9BURK|nr:hypothetical protein [Paraburkholderia antibiotica]NML34525.1 hypothetical protein [Paraburkholderia antibiotica]